MDLQGFDQVTRWPCGSLLQHGPANDRVYLMEVGAQASSDLPLHLIEFAKARNYGKIFSKLRRSQTNAFLQAGFSQEAAIPGLFQGKESGHFLSIFLHQERRWDALDRDNQERLALAQKQTPKPMGPLPRDFALRRCLPSDLSAMAELYRCVFPTYPFPIQDEGFLRETMKAHVRYFGVFSANRLLALASAECSEGGAHAEMTDFATYPEARGQGLALHLLTAMEESLKGSGYVTAFTIARAPSAGMNITFARAGYFYGGTLVNNTQISGRIESMNVWYKPLRTTSDALVAEGS